MPPQPEFLNNAIRKHKHIVNVIENSANGNAEAIFEQALAMYRRGDARSAYESCAAILETRPHFHRASHLAGVIAFEQGHHATAEGLLHEAISMSPDSAAYYCDLALPLRSQEKYQEALAALDQALTIDPAMAAALSIRASLLAFLGRGDAAADTLEKLCGLRPEDPDAWLRLALARRNLGDLSAARTSIEKALTLRPDFPAAYWILSSLVTATEASNHIPQMESLLHSCTDSHAQVELCFALAKEHEDLAQYERAFEYLARGNAQRRAQLDYDLEQDRQLFARIRASFQKEKPQDAEDVDGGPIFVVGLPRTGSTLLERILTGHSDVSSAGELQIMERLVGFEERDRAQPFPDFVAGLTNSDLKRIGHSYIDKSQAFRGETKYFVDKMPLNFLYVGLILQALPAARIINMRRDPVDTCFSCYKQLFGAHYRFSYDLQELAAYYKLYDELMLHWQALAPGRIMDVHYEMLVRETEEEARRVFSFCDLPWEAACLEFQRASGTVNTPSAVQVRQAIHSQSVGRWRCYEKQLKPLARALSDALPADS